MCSQHPIYERGTLNHEQWIWIYKKNLSTGQL